LSEPNIFGKAINKKFMVIFFVIMITILSMGKIDAQGRWLDFHYLSIPELDLREEEIENYKKTMVEVLDIFRNAPPLNPPRGFEILPRINISSRLILPDGDRGPVQSRITMAMWFPEFHPRDPATSRASVWFNNPESFLGDPILADDRGNIYLLPPVVEQSPGGNIFSRGAHPPGYEEAYPSYSMFPLWDSKIEPFLRSVVRPSFELGRHEGAVTVLTRDGKPFWVPVSQERWIRALQDYARREIEAVQLGFEAAEEVELTQQQITQIRNYMAQLQRAFSEEEIVKNHEKMVNDFMDLYEYYKTVDADVAQNFYETTIENADQFLEEQLEMASEMRREFAEMEEKILYALMARQDFMEEMDVLIKAEDWDGLEELGRELDLEKVIFLAYAGRAINGLEFELASLSPGERAAQAYGFELPEWHPFGPHRQVVAMPFEAVRFSGLVAPDSEGARALVAVDPNYFNPNLTPTAIQLMVIDWWEETHPSYYSPTGSAYNEIRVQLLGKIWNSLEWSALRGFLR